MPVKRFLYSFYIHTETLVKGWSILNMLIIHVSQRKKQVLYINCNLLDNDVNTEM